MTPQVAALRKWLKGLPLSRRPLVKLSARVAPEPAVKMLQASAGIRWGLWGAGDARGSGCMIGGASQAVLA